MRLEVIILPLFACAACALQLQDVERRDNLFLTKRSAGSGKFSRRTSIHPSGTVARRNNGPRSASGQQRSKSPPPPARPPSPACPLPASFPHQNVFRPTDGICPPAHGFLQALEKEEKNRVYIRNSELYAKIYRITLFSTPVVVKEINVGYTRMGTFIRSMYHNDMWTEDAVHREVYHLDRVGQLFAYVPNEPVHHIVMHDLGVPATELSPQLHNYIKAANNMYFAFFSVLRAKGTDTGLGNYVFQKNRPDEGHPVGGWRYAYFLPKMDAAVL